MGELHEVGVCDFYEVSLELEGEVDCHGVLVEVHQRSKKVPIPSQNHALRVGCRLFEGRWDGLVEGGG